MATTTVVTNIGLGKSKHTFLLHLLTGCLIFYGLMINTNTPVQQNAKIENVQTFFTETVDFTESDTFKDVIDKKNPLLDFRMPAPYTGKKSRHIYNQTTKN